MAAGGLVAGLLSGVVCWVISLVYPALYVGGLINELTTFAAFTALLVFLPAITAVAVGRWLVDRKAPPLERRREAGWEEDRADTDVFAAVRDDERTVETAGVQEYPEQQTSSVALAERDPNETTETITPADEQQRPNA